MDVGVQADCVGFVVVVDGVDAVGIDVVNSAAVVWFVMWAVSSVFIFINGG